MSPEIWQNVKLIAVSALILVFGIFLSRCSTTENILAGSNVACGQLHVEGYLTDSQGEIVVAKVPEGWTPEQVTQFCDSQ